MADSQVSKVKKVLIVDKDKCLGCGLCVSIASKSFKLGNDGKSEPINPPGDSKETLRQAIDSCPVSAIKFVQQN